MLEGAASDLAAPGADSQIRFLRFDFSEVGFSDLSFFPGSIFCFFQPHLKKLSMVFVFQKLNKSFYFNQH